MTAEDYSPYWLAVMAERQQSSTSDASSQPDTDQVPNRKSRRELELVVESQKEQLSKYETRLRDVVRAYKGLVSHETIG